MDKKDVLIQIQINKRERTRVPKEIKGSVFDSTSEKSNIETQAYSGTLESLYKKLKRSYI